jgi:two-component system, NtrC family, nitrogen regulation sensor histidine kinase NtrY
MAADTTSLQDDGHHAGGASPLLDVTDRAFWVGLVVVVLSVIAALATYLILTGLTPIPPRDDVVVIAL